jgi:hypothetical protein
MLDWRVRPRVLAALVLVAAAPAGLSAGEPPGIPPEVQRRMADIPRPVYRPTRAPDLSAPPLRRTADLLRLLWDGAGTFRAGGSAERRLHASFNLDHLPWSTSLPQVAQLVTLTMSASNEESVLSLVLREQDRWCTPPLELEAESRLRFEGLSLEAAGRGRLRVWLEAEGGPAFDQTLDASPPADASPPQADLLLPPGRASVCFEAVSGTVSVGEPRILAPEPPGTDPRPRWVVFMVHDTLRADVLTGPDAERLMPGLLGLAERGIRYDDAISTGAHTLASTFPLFTGRYLARINPLLAFRVNPRVPFSAVETRANLFVSQLAQDAGYHSVFLGNNSFLKGVPVFSRFSNHGQTRTGTVDTVAVLPQVLERYADERVLLTYWVSAPHAYSFTPRRLYEELGCLSRRDLAAVRCAYDARVRHSDEALEALEEGLAQNGLLPSTLQVITADHGEAFGDGRRIEIETGGLWRSTIEGHGGTTHPIELHVPLVVTGPGISPAVVRERVSTLDIVPTIARLLDLETPHRIDGVVLPLLGGPRVAAARIVSFGYCSDSVLEGRRQLVWWETECQRRPLGGGAPFEDRAELFEDGRPAGTDLSAPAVVQPLVRDHLEWLAERLPGEALLLDGSRLGKARVTIQTPQGRLVDWGPSGNPGHFGRVAASVDPDGKEIRIDFEGFPGVFYVATWPPATPFGVDVRAVSGPPPVTFVGPLQLPLDLLGQVVDPREHRRLWLATSAPSEQPGPGPSLALWRQPFRTSERVPVRALNELDRVLREWGYIR